MVKTWTRLLLGMICLLGVSPAAAQTAKQPPARSSIAGEPIASVSNSFIRIDADSNGGFVFGTTGGDPANAMDDNRRLLFGFAPDGQSGIFSSLTTVRVVKAGVTTDTVLQKETPSSGPTAGAGSIVTTWSLGPGVEVTQSLVFADNPFSGRADQVLISYNTKNVSGGPLDIGVRIMLDVMVGNNDAAPYFVPGTGNTSTEQEFLTPNIPANYTSFESDTYATDSLKGQGVVSRPGQSAPDRFLIASWRPIFNTDWDYTVTPTAETGDSVTAMYWNPAAVTPGATRTVSTSYGLAGTSGGSIFSDSPVLLPLGTSSMRVTIYINNATTTPFSNGSITLTLPSGLSLSAAPGASTSAQSLTLPLGTIAPGKVGQAQWDVAIAAPGVYEYSATAMFASGTPPLVSNNRVSIGRIIDLYLPRVSGN